MNMVMMTGDVPPMERSTPTSRVRSTTLIDSDPIRPMPPTMPMTMATLNSIWLTMLKVLIGVFAILVVGAAEEGADLHVVRLQVFVELHEQRPGVDIAPSARMTT
jgi:hypothetical protein